MRTTPDLGAAVRGRKGIRIAVSAFFAIPALLIWSMVYFSPFDSPYSASIGAFSSAPAALAAGTEFALIWIFLRQKYRRPALILLGAFIIVGVSSDIAMGFALHRDFFSAFFMRIIQAIIAGLYASAYLAPRRSGDGARRLLFSFALATSALWTLWLMLMGYALVVRSEPRWGEAISYNFYNSGLAAMLYALCFRLSLEPRRSLRAERERFLVDGIDFSSILGKGACMAAYHLVNRAGRVTCADIVLKEYGRDCRGCARVKASACPDYRNIYNSLRLFRCILDVMRLGSVVSAANKNRIVEEGWLFVPERSVLVDYD